MSVSDRGNLGPIKFRNRAMEAPFTSSSLLGLNTLFSYRTMFTLPAEFEFARAWFNTISTTAGTIGAVYASPSSMLDITNPKDSTGTSSVAACVPLYFNGGGVDTPVYPPPAGTTRGFSGPVATAVSPATANAIGGSIDTVQGFCCTDWAAVRSIPRIDGGTGTLLQIGVTSPGYLPLALSNRPPMNNSGSVGGVAWDAVAQGRAVRCGYTLTDTVTTPVVISGTATASPNFTPYGLEVITRRRCLTVAIMGDSLDVGWGTTLQQNNPYRTAFRQAADAVGFPVSVCQVAYSGMTSAGSFGSLAAAMAGIKPDVIIFEPMTPNEGFAVANQSASFARMYAVAAAAAENGVLPVLLTQGPWGLGSSVYETARQGYNANLRAAGIANGWPVIDVDLAIADPATPANMLAAYMTGTDKHYNDAGAAAILNLADVGALCVAERVLAVRPR